MEGVILNPNCSCSHLLGNYCILGASYRTYVIQDISLSRTYAFLAPVPVSHCGLIMEAAAAHRGLTMCQQPRLHLTSTSFDLHKQAKVQRCIQNVVSLVKAYEIPSMTLSVPEKSLYFQYHYYIKPSISAY